MISTPATKNSVYQQLRSHLAYLRRSTHGCIERQFDGSGVVP
jgi:hypothetical protein